MAQTGDGSGPIRPSARSEVALPLVARARFHQVPVESVSQTRPNTGPYPAKLVEVDVCVVGGGQAGLAVGYHLRRLSSRSSSRQQSRPLSGGGQGRDLSFVILDDHPEPGGAWQDMWNTLHLFSPAAYSSLPGWPMPRWRGADSPSACHVAEYFAAYEKRYELPVERPVSVVAVHTSEADDRLLVESAKGRVWSTRWLVNATGTWRRPFWPHVPGIAAFAGRQLHTADYPGSAEFAGQRILVVGGGNSGAQIAADLLPVAAGVTWVTKTPPRLLPDEVDGRVLFEAATRAVRDRTAGIADDGAGRLGDIVAVPSFRRARDQYGLRAEPMFDRLTLDGARWADGHQRRYDVVIWCTGFRPALRHLRPLSLATRRGGPRTAAPVPSTRPNGQGAGCLDAAKSSLSPVVTVTDLRVMFVGYGDWCGPASASLIGVNKAARDFAATLADGARVSR